jgi:hypothetical protein
MRMQPGPRLLPIFRLPGHVLAGREAISIELRPFNTRQLNRDLLAVCPPGERTPPNVT